jgi:hypothetical protein
MKLRLVLALHRYVLNPPIVWLFRLGVVPPGYAMLETIGRRSREARRTPVGDGLIGTTFWIVAEHGRARRTSEISKRTLVSGFSSATAAGQSGGPGRPRSCRTMTRVSASESSPHTASARGATRSSSGRSAPVGASYPESLVVATQRGPDDNAPICRSLLWTVSRPDHAGARHGKPRPPARSAPSRTTQRRRTRPRRHGTVGGQPAAPKPGLSDPPGEPRPRG